MTSEEKCGSRESSRQTPGQRAVLDVDISVLYGAELYGCGALEMATSSMTHDEEARTA